MLGHASITLTVDTYAHLLAGVGRRAADAADALIIRKPRDQSVTNEPPAKGVAASRLGETAGQTGGPRGDRTHNPRIKSPLLCQLS